MSVINVTIGNGLAYFESGQEYDIPWSSVRKMPVVVEAVKMGQPFEVETPEGVMRGNHGDYLMRGVRGELYPCKREIFEQTYEEA